VRHVLIRDWAEAWSLAAVIATTETGTATADSRAAPQKAKIIFLIVMALRANAHTNVRTQVVL
jgi:hypothetical protein